MTTDLKPEREETESKDSIICPWCFHMHHDPDRWFNHGIIRKTYPCEACVKPFRVRTETTYFAKPVDP